MLWPWAAIITQKGMKTLNLHEKLEKQARENPQRIAFPEAHNELILQAAAQMLHLGVGTPVLMGRQDEAQTLADQLGISLSGFEFVDSNDESVRAELAKRCAARFPNISEKAVMRRGKDPLNAAMYLCKMGEVDGVAAGKEYTTGDVISSGMNILGLKEGFETVSSLGLLNVPGFDGPEGSLLAIADCAVNTDPDANSLAEIALSSAATMHELLGWEPRVAMLAFSTCGSASHPSIEVILQAIEIAKIRKPDLLIDGEFQLDSAIIPKVAQAKVKRESQVAGRANVLIFPNLHAGNIGVKLVQIFGRADAYGPVLQGFARPLCDFSRSAPLSEMWGNILMLIVRAGAANKA